MYKEDTKFRKATNRKNANHKNWNLVLIRIMTSKLYNSFLLKLKPLVTVKVVIEKQ